MIGEFLSAAQSENISAVELSVRWHVTEITLICTLPFEFDFAMGGRVRGALGHQLKSGASNAALKNGKCDWAAPCAFDILFNTQGKITSRLEIPKPWCLHCQPVAQGLRISLKLFGVAGNWAGEVADALVRAVRAGLSTGYRTRQKLTVLDRHIQTCTEPEQAVQSSGPVVLSFTSPLMLRQGNEIHHDPASLLKSLGNRVNGLARWHGISLELDAHAFAEEAEALGDLALWEGVKAYQWQSHSSRQRRNKPMGGVTGQLFLPPPSVRMQVLLALGSSAQSGSHTTLGLGVFSLTGLPTL